MSSDNIDFAYWSWFDIRCPYVPTLHGMRIEKLHFVHIPNDYKAIIESVDSISRDGPDIIYT